MSAVRQHQNAEEERNESHSSSKTNGTAGEDHSTAIGCLPLPFWSQRLGRAAGASAATASSSSATGGTTRPGSRGAGGLPQARNSLSVDVTTDLDGAQRAQARPGGSINRQDLDEPPADRFYTPTAAAVARNVNNHNRQKQDKDLDYDTDDSDSDGNDDAFYRSSASVFLPEDELKELRKNPLAGVSFSAFNRDTGEAEFRRGAELSPVLDQEVGAPAALDEGIALGSR